MRPVDAFRITLHTIRYNKVRTLLTVLIVTVVSLLVMFLLLVGISFSDNLQRVARAYFRRTGAQYAFTSLRSFTATGTENRPITSDEYALFLKTAEAHREVLGDDMAAPTVSGSDLCFFFGEKEALGSGTVFGEEAALSLQNPSLINSVGAKTFLTVPEGISFCQGRAWTPEDGGSPNIFVSRGFQQKIEAEGAKIEVGGTVCLARMRERSSSWISLGDGSDAEAFTVAGIYEGYGADILIGMGKLFELSGKDFGIRVYDITAKFYPPQADYDYEAVTRSIREFTDTMSGSLEQPYGGFEAIPGFEVFVQLFSDYARRFTCTFVDSMRIVELLSTIVIGVFFLLAMIVLLLSVGSIANSVVISIDKNKRFFGLMKAVGLDSKGIRALVYAELFLVILSGVLLGVCLLFLFLPVAESIISSLFAYLWGALMQTETVVSVPYWLPLGTIAFFFLITLLFSLGSIKKISSQDVTAIFAEVA